MRKHLFAGIFAGIILFAGLTYMLQGNTVSQVRMYTAEELDIAEIASPLDADGDGLDDYSDIMAGARAYIDTNPRYKSIYYEGGYPDDGFGVCTDVIWNAFQAAGYNLKSLVDMDIAQNTGAYPSAETPDSNIDFRRVANLKVFLERKALNLGTDLANPEEWQPGDIVVFSKHIAICSDRRNADGIPYIIHHDGMGAREADDLGRYTIKGHFRWQG
ncbi:DUF1287 domain-containing protein [Parasporobacterium paucivorans]|uniref:DUF1287 domain-containing protein n=1 Tax=Parasporobacterium paucivorans DSM 15970 TaxID=1122934 RepID=A0A1M6BCW2_9FIRM|nr:DUF1287 domain-containing protein [Parasporobacterium paucivorans]SHI46408.1 hypothetical protein SAMN02745691_00321 [Parasporobacterium paucivorans DSM 15970]